MKYLITFFILLIFDSISAQNLTLTYEFDVSRAINQLDNEIKNNKNEVNQGTILTRNALDLLHFFTYTLKIDDSKSQFFLTNELQPENIDPTTFAIAKTIANKGEFFQDRNNNLTLWKKIAFNKDFIIESKLDKNIWQVSNIPIEINGYTTYKATTFIQDLDRDGGNRDIEIEVWFAPEIPLPFGPEGYGGLPGLILKKCQGNTCFNLVNIKNEENLINLPKKERTSYETYYQFLEKMRDQRKN